MNTNKTFDNDFLNWIKEISSRFRQSQVKAACKVNVELLKFYWELGKDITIREKENAYGKEFYKKLSAELCRELPEVKSFSVTNLHYMKWFYELYSESVNLPQLGVNFPERLAMAQNTGDSSGTVDRFQLDEDSLKSVFSIPWGHHKLILDKCKNNQEKALFFVRKTMENNWSRAVLHSFLDTDLYERQGKAISNFNKVLPSVQSDLAQEMTKDPYNFDFLTLREKYDEKDLKNALMDNLSRFLLELGTGFAFVGREFRLEVGNTEQFIDMLFYNIRLHCYVVVEVKVRDFEPGYMGQIGTYVAAVDGILKSEYDAPTIGLLVCKNKDNVLAQYSVNSSNAPVGISEFELSDLVPENFKGTLPSIEDIERELES